MADGIDDKSLQPPSRYALRQMVASVCVERLERVLHTGQIRTVRPLVLQVYDALYLQVGIAAVSVPTPAEYADALYRTHFDAFAQRAFEIVRPNVAYEWNWHLGCIAEHLEAMYRGEISRLIINLPPRSLKSYLVSSTFPAWVLGKQPGAKFINTSYGLTVVEQNARNCKLILKSEWYQKLFPSTRIDPDMDRILHFETTKRGQFYADTALSTITGIGCEYMIIDDPIKPKEAFSDGVRASTNENIRSTLLNRYDDKRIGKLLLVMQRVHEDDTTGNLLKDGGYVHVKLPAETKAPISISLGGKTWEMTENSYLFPQRLGKKELDELRIDMTDLHYAGQYLQEPVPVGGGEFKPHWPQYYAPGGCKPKEMNICILVDPAGGEDLNRKKRKASDWTAMMVVGLAPDNNYYLLDIVRDRLDPSDRVDMLFVLHRKWNSLTGKSPKVGYEKYSMQSDIHYITKKKQQDAYNFALIEVGGTMMKEERIRQLIPDMRNGHWFLPQSLIYVDGEGRRFDLVQELVGSEMPNFPRARFDDMLDALSRIYTPELSMVFPKQKIGTVAKARREAASQPDNWEQW